MSDQPMTQAEIAACKARCEAATGAARTDIPRLLATVEARDELLREGAVLLKPYTTLGSTEEMWIAEIRAAICAKEG